MQLLLICITLVVACMYPHLLVTCRKPQVDLLQAQLLPRLTLVFLKAPHDPFLDLLLCCLHDSYHVWSTTFGLLSHLRDLQDLRDLRDLLTY